MATGERIRFFRVLRGMTQKYLGTLLGFPERSADVRMAQYESEDRTPKADLTAALADALDVSPKAITVPDIDSLDGLMHTLFTLEDRKLLSIREYEGLVCLRADIFQGGSQAERFSEMPDAIQIKAHEKALLPRMTVIHSRRAYEKCVSCKPDTLSRIPYIIPAPDSHRNEE